MHKDSQYAHMPFNAERVNWFIRNRFDGTNREGFVALHDDVIIGFLGVYAEVLYFTDAKTVFDIAMFVHPDYRHPRVSAQLVFAAERWAQSIGAHNIIMSVTAPEDGERVGNLYMRYGYKPLGQYYSKEVH